MGDEFLRLSGGDRVFDARICFMFFVCLCAVLHFVCFFCDANTDEFILGNPA